MEIKVWDIIRANVPNTENHKISKERPVLLVKIDDNGESDTFLKISSVPHNDFKQVPIEDMRGSSLNKLSYINMDTAYTLNRTNFPKNRPRGHLSIHDIANVSKEIIKSGMDINNPVDLNDSINPIAKALGKDYKNIPLEDDETETGGIAFAGETLGDFIDEVGGIGEFASLEELNSALVSNGIKPVGKVKKESIEKPTKKRIKIKNYPMLSKGGDNAIVEVDDFNSLKKRISKFTPNVSVSNSNSKEMFELHDDISNNKNLSSDEKRKLVDMLFDRLKDKKEESLKEELENPSEDMPKPGIDTGIADQLITLINGEWDTIKDYNSFIATVAELDTFQEATDVIKDIVNEEHLHVGQLQALLQKVSPNTSSIAKGEEEGREQIEEA